MDWPTVSNFLSAHADKVPFMALAVNGDGKPRFSGVRLVEALIIAILSAGLTMWGAQNVIATKIDNLTTSFRDMRVDQKTHQAMVDDRLYNLERDLSRLQGKMEGTKK